MEMEVILQTTVPGNFAQKLLAAKEALVSYDLPVDLKGRVIFVFTNTNLDQVPESLAPFLAKALTNPAVQITGYAPVVETIVASRRAFNSPAWRNTGTIAGLSFFEFGKEYFQVPEAFWDELEHELQQYWPEV